jgi:mono/diheme cytochrome c family protein
MIPRTRPSAIFWRSCFAIAIIGTLLGTTVLAATKITAPTDAASIKKGGSLYQRSCATCHGLSGKGDGPVARALTTKPSDFSKGEFRHGDSDEQVYKSIEVGIPKNGMVGWKGKMSQAEMLSVVAYLRTLKK